MAISKTNLELSTMVFEAFNDRDFSIIEPWMDENIYLDFPGVKPVEGKRKFLIFTSALLRSYPRLIFSVHDILLDGDKSCIIWTNEGLDSFGKRYANRGVTLVEIRDGKISLLSDYFKDTSFTNK